MISESELVFRLTLALFLGGLIGYERQARHKSAGLKTNSLVCLGSCLIMILSITLYQGVEGKTNADPARLAAQVVSGIGFLGAGAIMKEGLTVKGLTTAACIWVVSGVGLAVGAGYYMGALATAVLVFFTLGILSRIDKLYDRNLDVAIDAEESPVLVNQLSKALEELQIELSDVAIKDRSNGKVHIQLAVHNCDIKHSLTIISRLKEIDGVLNVEINT